MVNFLQRRMQSYVHVYVFVCVCISAVDVNMCCNVLHAHVFLFRRGEQVNVWG